METVVVRLWVGVDPPGERAPLRGVLEHPAADRRAAFATEDELVALLREIQMSAARGDARVGS